MGGWGGRGRWDDVRAPLELLLRQSDVEGRLTPPECWAVRCRIHEIVRPWPAPDREMPLRLAAALAEAAFRNNVFRWF
jgi:hypothetical protein